MKPILIILIFAEIYGAFSTNITLQGQRETTDIGDFVSSIAQELDETIGTVSIAVTNAIHNVKLWTGGNVDARLNLLTELQTFQHGLHNITLEITKSIVNGTIITQYRPLLLKLNFFLTIHLNNINNLITILIPTMEDLTATQAITSCLDATRAIEAAIEKIHDLFSS